MEKKIVTVMRALAKYIAWKETCNAPIILAVLFYRKDYHSVQISIDTVYE